jgi:hypothetical protein
MVTLRRDQIDMRNDIKSEIAEVNQGMERGFKIVNANMKQFAMQVSMARRMRTTAGMQKLATAAAGGEEIAMGSGGGAAIGPALAMTNPPTLMPQPKSLYDLRNEYLNGVGGESLQGFSPPLSEGGSNASISGESKVV